MHFVIHLHRQNHQSNTSTILLFLLLLILIIILIIITKIFIITMMDLVLEDVIREEFLSATASLGKPL